MYVVCDVMYVVCCLIYGADGRVDDVCGMVCGACSCHMTYVRCMMYDI